MTIYVSGYVYACVYVCTCMRIYMYVCLSIYIYIWVYIRCSDVITRSISSQIFTQDAPGLARQGEVWDSFVLRTRLIQIRDCNSALDTSSIPPMHGGFLLISHKRLWHFLSCLMFRRFVPSFPIYRWIVLLTTINQKPCKMWYIYTYIDCELSFGHTCHFPGFGMPVTPRIVRY